jgi:hypothetical protein
MISFSFAARGVDLLNDLIGRLSALPFMPLFVVLADGVFLQQLLEDIDPVATHVPDRDPRPRYICWRSWPSLFVAAHSVRECGCAKTEPSTVGLETKVGVLIALSTA